MAFRPKVRSILALVLAVAAVTAIAVGCATKHSAPTGGGGGTTLELNSGSFGNGTTYAHRFFAAGDYAYHCQFHGVMTGTVSVNAGAADTIADVFITSSTVPFPAASVKPGGVVTWHNNSGMNHTVTSN